MVTRTIRFIILIRKQQKGSDILLEMGYESGCLKVISNDFDANYQNIIESIKPIAKQEWEELKNRESINLSWKTNFVNYYKLNKIEVQMFDEKLSMPESFIKKFLIFKLKTDYFRLFRQLSNILWHQKKPNTIDDLVEALVNQQVYEVECKICGKRYFMDETSICCLKRKSCSGANCLSTTVTNKARTYNNLCIVNNESNTLQVLDKQLAAVENIVVPLSFYGGCSELNVSYISDIHLLHHLPVNIIKKADINKLINTTVKRLYSTMSKNGIIVFAGDTSSDVNITMQFYKKFVEYKDYLEYKNKKRELLKIKKRFMYIDIHKSNIETKLKNMKCYISNLKQQTIKYLDFKTVEQYKSRYHKHDSWGYTIECYKKIPSYKAKGVASECDHKLDLIAQKLDLLEAFEIKYAQFLIEHEKSKQSFSEVESIYGKSIETLTMQDVYTKHQSLSDDSSIFVILGNHEYVGFKNIQEAISFYDNKLKSLGIKLLQNNYSEEKIEDKRLIIFGGTGFAKYNEKFNADSLVCCDNFTRDIEIKESTLFETEYRKAKKLAKDKNACFLCVSHYPIRDCMKNIDPDTIYFYGHNHQNFYHRNETEIIYADNQIGYENPNIDFKIMSTGFELNPYWELEDGLYETTIKDYLQFYRYLGEFIGDGTLLYQRCQNDKASLYVIKRKGYYGFFIVNQNAGTSKGISIVNGGKTKKITKSVDLQWLFDNFEVVLSKYLKVLAPFRNVQEQLSKELKILGLSGSIHGCIIDIDFYHHIMLNPLDGTMTYYYSSAFGLVRSLSSFDKVILSMKDNDVSSGRDYDLLRSQFNNMRNNSVCLLSKINSSYLLSTSTSDISELDTKEEIISRSDGIYGLSRKINSLQRIFTNRTLRDFNLKLVDSQPSIEPKPKKFKRKFLY